MCEPGPGSMVASVPCSPQNHRQNCRCSLARAVQRGPTTFPDLPAALPVPGAGAESSLGPGWSLAVAPLEQHLSANGATLDGCPAGSGI